jgi:hypothetical protein
LAYWIGGFIILFKSVGNRQPEIDSFSSALKVRAEQDQNTA